MNVPFTIEQFLGVFRRYNQAIWPTQVIAFCLGAACVFVLVARRPGRIPFVFSCLGTMWLWNGVVYHWQFFRPINPAAAAFAALFILQGGVLLFSGFQRKQEPKQPHTLSAVGWIAITYALILYPAVGLALGHVYPANPVFGVAPCPTVIFTLGILMVLGARASRILLVVPVLWAIVGTSAALSLGMWEDLGLPLFALAAIIAAIARPQPFGTPVRGASQ